MVARSPVEVKGDSDQPVKDEKVKRKNSSPLRFRFPYGPGDAWIAVFFGHRAVLDLEHIMESCCSLSGYSYLLYLAFLPPQPYGQIDKKDK